MPKASEISRKWHVVDAKGQTLGRLASVVASLLMGKHKVERALHADIGDHVIIINAAQVVLTGNKVSKKVYRHHTGHPGGLKEVLCKDLLRKSPEKILELAIKGMLPKSVLGRQAFRRLRVYKDANHAHEAQQPEMFEILSSKRNG